MRTTAISIALGHVLLIMSYTMPKEVVPIRLRYWSQAYARVLFHQDWRLFAPDPPDCGCSIAILQDADGEPHLLEDLHRGFVWKRMAANACRYAEASWDGKNRCVVPGEALGTSLLHMTGYDPRSDGIRFGVLRPCGCRTTGLLLICSPELPME